MSHAVIAWGRFNPPTEEGHGKLVKAVQDHAEKVGGTHYIFPTHTQDKKKNPMTHEDKVSAMKSLFPKANVVSHDKVKTIIDAMKHLESKGHKEVTVVAGSDRVPEYHKLLNNYRTKEYPGIKKVNVVSAGHRDPDAEGAEGMSASKLRGLVSAGKKKEFVSHYSDPKLGAQIHDKVKAGMQMESVNPVGIFLIGGPGSGKDYVLSNIFSRFDLTEVQIDHLLNGSADELLEQKKNIVINGSIDSDKIAVVNSMLEGYDVDYVYVSVTNKVSRLRNGLRENPLAENKRIEKWLRAEKLAESVECFKFNNSINLNESSDFEKVFFADQIEKLLSRLVEHGLELQEVSEAKTFAPVAKHKSGLPKKYVGKLSHSTALARKAHWKKMSKYSDRDPRAYAPAPGDATSKTKPSKHTLAVRRMMDEQVEADVKHVHSVEDIAAKHKVAVADIIQALAMGKQVEREHTNDEKTAETIALAHLWEKPDYYTQLAKMEQHTPPTIKVTDAQHQAAERKDQIRRDRRDWRILHHQNRLVRAAEKGSMSEAEDKPLPPKLRKASRSGNITAVMDKRKETGRVDEGAADTSLSAKAKKSGVSLSTLRKVYNRGVAAWNSGHRPGTTPQQWGHARVNSYINKGKTYHTADKDLREETDLDELFEMQLVGTDEYRKHAIATTPGQGEPVDAFPVKDPNKKPVAVPAKKGKSIVSQYAAEATNCCPDSDGQFVDGDRRYFDGIEEAKEADGKEDGVDFTPDLKPSKLKKGLKTPGNMRFSYLDGLPIVTARVNEAEVDASTMSSPPGFEYKSAKPLSKIRKAMPVPRQVPAPPGGHPVPPGYKRVRDHIAGWKIVKEDNEQELSLKEAVEFHLENQISFTENVFRPGSDMFFQMIDEAKRLYKEGKYTPADEYEIDMLNSDIGEVAEFEGQTVVLDFPIEEGLEECWSGYTQKGMKKKGDKMVPNCVPVNEEDKTNGKGIGKPWQEGGGGAVYVKVGDSVRKISFSKSGMKKKYMDPAATRSFVARHHCLTNKDKTSASYWACRWPRFFSNSGKIWW